MDALPARRALACTALGLLVLAAGVLIGVAGRRGLWLLLLTAAAVAVVTAAGFWFLQQRGVLRWAALAVAVAVPAAVLVAFVLEGLLWVALGSAALLGAAAVAGRSALRPVRSDWALPVVDVPAPLRPFLVMNPRSGGGKVVRFDLQRRAEELGAEVALLDHPHTDVTALARDAVARGADLLGAAGGDGTQALVAQVAADAGLPFLVISAGTRNHFALDLGLDREDPARGLTALVDGVEARIDLGQINGRPFVNNASFGAYAEVVDDPDYRDDKRGTALSTLPDLLSGRRGPALHGDADGVSIEHPQALLVSNNPYEATDLASMGRRARLDRGTLGVIAVQVTTARQALGLLRGASRRGLLRLTAHEVVVRSDDAAIPVGVDGESVHLSTPVRCTVRPGVLRVRLPRDRPGVRPPRGRLEWAPLWGLALGRPPGAAPGSARTGPPSRAAG